MATENQKGTLERDDKKGLVDLEEELISDLIELNKERKKKKSFKEKSSP